jgi:hypothetical protein
MKIKNLTGITAKKGAMADILIKDGFAIAGDAYMVARVPVKTEETPNGVYQKGYFQKPILTIEGKTVFYGDETKSPEIEPVNLGTDFYPDVEKVIDSVKSANRMTLDIAKLKKLLGVFTEQGIGLVTLAIPDEANKPLQITGDTGSEQLVTAVLMPINTTQTTKD